PLGGQLALLGALFDDRVKAVHVHGGLAAFRSLLDSPFLHVPHDAVVPGALTAGALPDVTAALVPRPVRLEGLVGGLNRKVGEMALPRLYQSAISAYVQAEVKDRLIVT